MAKKRANGEGNIRKRADGRWEGRYTAGYHPETGKRIIKNVLGKTQAECKAKLKKAIEESKALDISRANEYTVVTWLRTWFELYAKPHIRPSTMNYYHRNIEQHVAPAIGDIPLNKLTTRDLQKHFDRQEHNELDERIRCVREELRQDLGTESRRRLLHLLDAQNTLLVDSTLMSFTAGFKLAWGIATELEADGLYCFEKEDEEPISEVNTHG